MGRAGRIALLRTRSSGGLEDHNGASCRCSHFCIYACGQIFSGTGRILYRATQKNRMPCFSTHTVRSLNMSVHTYIPTHLRNNHCDQPVTKLAIHAPLLHKLRSRMQGVKSMGSSQEAGMGHPAAQVSEGQNAEKDPVVHDEIAGKHRLHWCSQCSAISSPCRAYTQCVTV